jgi:D-glycero-alpha-D-manno-heptose-7-phosphate kinase
MNNWAVLRAALDGDARVRAGLQEIADASRDMADAVAAPGRMDALLERAREALRREWTARRTLAPEVSSPEVERIIAAAESIGGAAKVCGAGGGGCVVAIPAAPEREAELSQALEGAGALVLAARPEADGVRIETWRDR